MILPVNQKGMENWCQNSWKFTLGPIKESRRDGPVSNWASLKPQGLSLILGTLVAEGGSNSDKVFSDLYAHSMHASDTHTLNN